ncbi:ANTAR domain-containing protein [Amycolatopsis carbonis]|uniref:ANTAR domain-containing protein n=1 Tax=Amycolatopsis carbonis TaxID=715471 RepID=A0A9Y2IQB4_9PSEU|nr:ANTAR domain-containing protein [Amycolatopsis sp. 2-15]WIX82803.1 ANTAR domain-containing protein [Amycolatopsis sp. 2-15]
MSAERYGELVALLRADNSDPAARLRRVCGLCVEVCAVTGGAITVQGGDDGTAQAVACATDAISLVLDNLQRTVGEGPGPAAHERGGPALVGDLATAEARWPGFTPGARAAGVAAVFSFPLRLGAVRLGTLDLYRTSVGSLNRGELRDALALADIAAHTVLDDLRSPDPMDIGWLSDIHAVVHQATGVVTAQLDVTMRDALLLIRAHAYAHQTPLDQVSQQIISKRLRLETGE